MQTTFNTGRPYTTEGQLITARATVVVVDPTTCHYVVDFFDHSRHIGGHAEFYIWMPEPPTEFCSRAARRLVRQYDQGRYTPCTWDPTPATPDQVHEWYM